MAEKYHEHSDSLHIFERAKQLPADSVIDKEILIHIHVSLGDIYIKQGDFAEAIKAFENADNLTSSNNQKYKPLLAEAYYNLGRNHANDKKYIEAIADFNKAAQLAPENLKYKMALGEAYLADENYFEAVTIFQAIYDTSDNNNLVDETKLATVYHELGKEYGKIKRYPEAVNFFVKAAKLVTEHNELKKAIGSNWYVIANNFFKVSLPLPK